MTVKNKSILITGGCGFIGSNLITRLIEECRNLRILDNLSVGKEENIPHNVELIVGDVRDKNAISKAMEGIEIVIHLAAHTSVMESIKQPQFDFDVNVLGAFNILQQCLVNRVEKFICASSNAAVGEQEPPITEDAVPAPASPYGASKLSTEALCSAFMKSYGLQTIILRFANVYGPRSNHKESVVAKFFGEFMDNRKITIYGDGNQTRDFVYVDDICQAILLSIETNSASGVFQIGTETETKIIDLAKQIRRLVGTNSDIFFEKARQGEIIRNYSCIEKARNLLGFEPQVDLNVGLKKTYDWFKKNQSI